MKSTIKASLLLVGTLLVSTTSAKFDLGSIEKELLGGGKDFMNKAGDGAESVVDTLSAIEDEDRDPLFTIPIIGITDIDMIDYTEGVGSGLEGEDIRGQFTKCAAGLPSMSMQLYKIAKFVLSNITHPLKMI